MKTLYFEGAGCVPRGDVENCRIRTAFTNDKGQRFYLELTGIETHEQSPERHKQFTNIGFVDFCYLLNEDEPFVRFDVESKNYEYSKAGILEFVNSELGCSFEAIKVTDVFYGYHVHEKGGTYNFMEDHNFDSDKAYRARVGFAILDTQIRRQLNSKYSKISLTEIGEDSLTVRCYASDKAMQEHGLNPQEREFMIKI